MTMLKPIAIATLVAGTLDILFAMILTLIFGREIPDMLRFVASGPFPAATDMGTSGAILGLLVHFALMAIMATVFVLSRGRGPSCTAQADPVGHRSTALSPISSMNWSSSRCASRTLPPKPLSIATQLFAHIVPGRHSHRADHRPDTCAAA